MYILIEQKQRARLQRIPKIWHRASEYQQKSLASATRKKKKKRKRTYPCATPSESLLLAVKSCVVSLKETSFLKDLLILVRALKHEDLRIKKKKKHEDFG